MPDTTVFRVGDWLVEPEFDRLSRTNVQHKIEPKTMAVLVELLRRPGHVVTTDELIRIVWGGRPMGDNPVYRCISRLRDVFGDTPTSPVYIGTVPRKGYRLLATVTVVDNVAGESRDIAEVEDEGVVKQVPPQHNLPARSTRFIGRERQTQELRDHLAHSRLVTLIGPGGCGKTRLAEETARVVAKSNNGSVFLIELAGLTEPDLIADEVANVLGLTTRQTGHTMNALVAHLTGHSPLILLDNCEHLIDGVAEVANALITRTAGVTVLATSREALRIDGELVYRVPSLDLPDRDTRLDRQRESEAIQLFADRAAFAKPDLTLTEATLSAAVDICCHLAGVPLAIELAAAQVRTLSPSQIALRLDAALQLLKGGSRVSPPRQRSLHAAIEWSYDLLSQEEKTLLHRLAVFAGSFTLEAMQSVCGPWTGGNGEILQIFSQLIEKSLVESADDDRGGYRYRLLPVVRQFALGRLENGAFGALRRKHLIFYHDLARRGHESLIAPHQPDWNRTLAEEHDNLRSALAWSLSGPDTQRGAEIAVFLTRFWTNRTGLLDEGRRWVETALSGANPEPGLRRRLRNKLARLQFLLGDLRSAEATATSTSDESEKAGDDTQLTMSLRTLAVCARDIGEFALASRHLERILDVTRGNGDFAGASWALGGLGEMSVYQGRLDEAMTSYRKGLAAAKKAGYRRNEAWILEGMALLEWRRGNLDSAAELTLDGLGIARDIGYDWHAGLHQFNLGLIAYSRDDFETADQLLTDGLRTVRSARVPDLLPEQLESMAAVAYDRGDVCFAATLLGAIESWCRVTGRRVNRRGPSDRFSAGIAASTDVQVQRSRENGRMMMLDEAVEFAISHRALSCLKKDGDVGHG